jgi:O-antigen ligase
MPLGRWMVWLAVVWASLSWGNRGWRNVQDAVQMSLPVLVGALSSIYVRRAADLLVFFKACGATLVGIGLIFVAHKGGILAAAGLEADIRACALTLALFGGFFIAALPDRWLMPLASWLGCMLLTFITGGRMATMALLVCPVFHPRLKSITLRVVAMALFACVGIGLFYTPRFQKRFFYEGKGTLTQVMQGEFLGFGRFEAWPLIYERAMNRRWYGYGAGSTREFVPVVWEDMTLPHNDYLRVFFEFGLLGLSVFLIASIGQIVALVRRSRRTRGVVRYAFAAAAMGWAIFLMAACTDNPLTYALWVTNPLFALMGAAYGVATREPRPPRRTGVGPDDDELQVTLFPLPNGAPRGHA